jgi:hypothetical protein
MLYKVKFYKEKCYLLFLIPSLESYHLLLLLMVFLFLPRQILMYLPLL